MREALPKQTCERRREEGGCGGQERFCPFALAPTTSPLCLWLGEEKGMNRRDQIWSDGCCLALPFYACLIFYLARFFMPLPAYTFCGPHLIVGTCGQRTRSARTALSLSSLSLNAPSAQRLIALCAGALSLFTPRTALLHGAFKPYRVFACPLCILPLRRTSGMPSHPATYLCDGKDGTTLLRLSLLPIFRFS